MSKEKEKSVIQISMACVCSECENLMDCEYDHDESIIIVEPCKNECKRDDIVSNVTFNATQYESIIDIIKSKI